MFFGLQQLMSLEIQLRTFELFVNIPENKDLREVSRNILVNCNFVLMESQFCSNILLKSGQDFAFSLMTKL